VKLIDELHREHALIEQVAGSLLAFATKARAGAASMHDAAGYLAFFHLYAGRYVTVRAWTPCAARAVAVSCAHGKT
jgi:hypothetical protein